MLHYYCALAINIYDYALTLINLAHSRFLWISIHNHFFKDILNNKLKQHFNSLKSNINLGTLHLYNIKYRFNLVVRVKTNNTYCWLYSYKHLKNFSYKIDDNDDIFLSKRQYE